MCRQPFATFDRFRSRTNASWKYGEPSDPFLLGSFARVRSSCWPTLTFFRQNSMARSRKTCSRSAFSIDSSSKYRAGILIFGFHVPPFRPNMTLLHKLCLNISLSLVFSGTKRRHLGSMGSQVIPPWWSQSLEPGLLLSLAFGDRLHCCLEAVFLGPLFCVICACLTLPILNPTFGAKSRTLSSCWTGRKMVSTTMCRSHS